MKIGKYKISAAAFLARIYWVLGCIWHVPFAYCVKPMLASGRIPHPLKPRGYQDLLLRNMMFPDNILRAVTADKIAARGWAIEKIGEQHATPLYGVCDDIDSLEKQNFPYPYVVKTNHASGQFSFVHDDQSRNEMLTKARGWDLGTYNPKLEWTYHDIQPKFMVEKMLIGENQTGAIDIKIYCLHGEPVLIHRIAERQNGELKTFFTIDWKMSKAWLLNPSAMQDVPKPEYLDEILNLARVLADDFSFCRVDFMVVGNQIYFGELTNTPAAGVTYFKPLSFDRFLYEEFERLGREKIAAKRLAYTDAVMTEFGIEKTGAKNG